MKTTIENSKRVYLITTSVGNHAFGNIEDLNKVVEELNCRAGYFKILHYADNKFYVVSKKRLKAFFEGANLIQNFYY